MPTYVAELTGLAWCDTDEEFAAEHRLLAAAEREASRRLLTLADEEVLAGPGGKARGDTRVSNVLRAYGHRSRYQAREHEEKAAEYEAKVAEAAAS